MKSISELRKGNPDNITRCSSFLKYFLKQDIDFDVWLPSKNMNLQREKVWTLNQKREIVWSVLKDRNIPFFSFINRVDDVWEVIDGKQRLTSLKDFMDDKFSLDIDGTFFLFSELPDEWRKCIENFNIHYFVMYQDYGKEITDKQKIDWMLFINFAGTPQDEDHMKKLAEK